MGNSVRCVFRAPASVDRLTNQHCEVYAEARSEQLEALKSSDGTDIAFGAVAPRKPKIVRPPDAAVRGTQLVARFLEQDVFPAFNAYRPSTGREWCLWGYFQRLLPIIRSQALLTQGSFFQTTIAATRTLLEILVDIILVAHSDPPDVAERILAWEDSAKLQHAEQGKAYLAGKGAGGVEVSAVGLYATWESFVAGSGDAIRERRKTLWPPRGKHPQRWSGRNLLDDCRRADQLESLHLEHCYQVEYRQMNWSIHGSGFASVRGLEAQAIDTAFALSHLRIAQFSLNATGICLSALGLRQELSLSDRLDQLATEWTQVARGYHRSL